MDSIGSIIKVAFHWGIGPVRGLKCFAAVRVSSYWAGSGFGGVHSPCRVKRLWLTCVMDKLIVVVIECINNEMLCNLPDGLKVASLS